MRIRILSTLAAWAVAFLIVFTLLSLCGDWLETLPPALNALLFTGILVPIMGNVVMPRINAILTKQNQSKK